MYKPKTSLGLIAILAIIGGYYLVGEDQVNYSSDVISSEHQPKIHKSSTPEQEVSSLVDITTLENNKTSVKTPEPDPIRYYSNTFASTEEYEAASQFGKLPAHMSDVSIEKLAFDANGNLIVDEKIKNLIEFFLLAKDVESKEQAIERLNEYLNLTLPNPANEQALTISAKYLNYKDKLQTQQFSDNTNLSDEANLAAINIALEERKRVRRQYLGEENSQAIFGYEESYDDFSLRRLEINANSSLSADEKNDLIAQAEQKLPKDLAEKMRFKREQKNIEKQITTLKQNGANESEIYNLRKDFYGEKVAERMAYLEDNSPIWQQRVSDFFEQQTLILNNSELSSHEKSFQIKQLKEQSFTYKEQVKLAVQSIRS